MWLPICCAGGTDERTPQGHPALGGGAGRDLARAKRAGVEPGSPQADELAERHRASIERFYDCGDAIHRNLVEMYPADERFTRYYEPGLSRGAELAAADGYPGLAAINLAVGINTELLGGGEAEKAIAKAEKALQLARQSGMHAAIVISLNSLALTLADLDPARARALLEESVERSAAPGEASPSGILTACLVAGRLQDWDLTLALAVRSMHLERWIMAPLQVAPCLAMCARALAENRPEVAGVLHGAAYATFRRAASEVGSRERSSTTPVGPHANFVLTAMHETGDIVAAALGDERRRALRTEGAAMSMDEAITYALANIDHKLLNNPIASIDR